MSADPLFLRSSTSMYECALSGSPAAGLVTPLTRMFTALTTRPSEPTCRDGLAPALATTSENHLTECGPPVVLFCSSDWT